MKPLKEKLCCFRKWTCRDREMGNLTEIVKENALNFVPQTVLYMCTRWKSRREETAEAWTRKLQQRSTRDLCCKVTELAWHLFLCDGVKKENSILILLFYHFIVINFEFKLNFHLSTECTDVFLICMRRYISQDSKSDLFRLQEYVCKFKFLGSMAITNLFLLSCYCKDNCLKQVKDWNGKIDL